MVKNKKTIIHSIVLLGFSLVSIMLWNCAPLTPPAGYEATVKDDSLQAEKEKKTALKQYLQIKYLNADTSVTAQPYIAFLPFKDKSDFREGVWEVETVFPHFLSAHFATAPEWRIVPYTVVREVLGDKKRLNIEEAFVVGQQVEADIIILGTLHDFNLERLSVGDPLIGGYKSYSGLAHIALDARRVGDQNALRTFESKKESVDRGLGLDLLGKPRNQDLQFVNLGKMIFGSDDFKGTAIGQATVLAADDLKQQLIELIQPSKIRLSGESAQILSAEANDIYINIGSQNGVHQGYRFTVYPSIDHAQAEALDPLAGIGVIEVVQVIGNRLSSVKVIHKKSDIHQGDLLKLVGEDMPDQDAKE